MRDFSNNCETAIVTLFFGFKLRPLGIYVKRFSMETVNQFRSQLMTLRTPKRISQQDLAIALGVTTHTVSNWEVGRTEAKLTPKQFKTLLKILQIPPEQLPDSFGPEEKDGKSFLRQLRERAGLTESELAKELSISGKVVSTEIIQEWEKTGEEPILSITQLTALCQALGVTAIQLADDWKPLQLQQEGEK